MKVIKRDGRIKEFDLERIKTAIKKANDEIHINSKHEDNKVMCLETIVSNIKKQILQLDKEKIHIEEIQDIIINELYRIDMEVAKAYQEYRNKRTEERERKSNLDKEIYNIIKAISEENTANGNVDGSKIQSIRALVANVACRDFSRRHHIPKKFRKKHGKEIYIHDEQYFGLPFYNCCLVNWEDMFKNGFDLGTTHIETPNSLKTAIDILSQVASHISSNTYGGTTFPNLIKGLTPYAKKSLNKYRKIADTFVMINQQDDYAWTMLSKEMKDSAQSLEYEIQTLMTSRGETPFSTLGINVIDLQLDGETQKIQKMLTKAILNQRLEGLTGGITPVFPKLVYQLEKGNNLNKEDKYYELFKLAVKVSAYRQYPDYTMTDRVKEVTGNYKEPMGKLLLM